MAGKTSERQRRQAVEQALQAMFQSLESQPVPYRLLSIVDELDADEPQPLKQARR